MLSDIGIMGLGTMGSALARNIASRGYRVSVWNRSHEKVTEFISKFGETSFYGAEHIEDFVESLEKPRKIIMLVPAGLATDEALENITRALDEGDCVMDGGNAYFKDTERYQTKLKEQGLIFLGCGVSGGEQGALYGPSLMPGGDEDAFHHFEEILSKIAAEDFSGRACVSYMGKKGAGHYVKMVHNGIEYAEMQSLAETYDLLKSIYKLPQEELASVFKSFDRGRLDSYLTHIAVDVLEKRDDDGTPLLDRIVDVAGQKGTGLWTSQEALSLGLPTPSITGAVFARGVSAFNETRVELSKKLPMTELAPAQMAIDFVQDLESALHLTRLLNFVQGFELLRAADERYGYGLNFSETVRIWQGGCIIRCALLKDFEAAFASSSKILENPWFHKTVLDNLQALRRVVASAASHGVPLFSMSGALSYIESLRKHTTSANFIQGLRDRFGAHGFERTDKPGNFHGEW